MLFWENFEGVLSDKTNAFGCFISEFAGIENIINLNKYPKSGLIYGNKRNVAWRVLDAKYFGIPQQRKRVYLFACDTSINPEKLLFEDKINIQYSFPKNELNFRKNNINFEIFREYTDCLYSAFGTKWNGNVAAYNGSLFIVQDNKLRRFSPLECERLMGFPDNYTNIQNASNTARYKAIGNSWVILVINWIYNNIKNYKFLATQ